MYFHRSGFSYHDTNVVTIATTSTLKTIYTAEIGVSFFFMAVLRQGNYATVDSMLDSIPQK